MSRRGAVVAAVVSSALALTVSLGAFAVASNAYLRTADAAPAAAPPIAAEMQTRVEAAQAQADLLGDRLRSTEAALAASQAERRRLEVERDALEARLAGDGALHRRIRIDRVDEAHALLPPKLMLSVSRLGRGQASICAGKERARTMFVGELIDLPVDGRDCWLVLLESGPEGARFVFGCDAETEA